MKGISSLYIIFLLVPLHGWSQSFTESSLPVVEINTAGLIIPSDGKIIANMEITFNGAGSVTRTSDIPNIWNGTVEIGLHGASSIGYPQKSYKFTTLLAGLEENISILDMPAEHDWILLNNWNDKSFIRNTLAHKIFSEMGHYGVRQRHCEVLLNGEYIGIYLLSEKIKRDKGRVNISKLTENENTGTAVSGGYIIKNDIYDGSNGWASKFYPVGHSTSDHPYFLYEYPSASNITVQQKNYIKAFIDTVETSLYSSTFDDPVNGYTKYISESSFIDYFLLNELARNVDGNKKSSYWYKDRWDKGKKLHAGPVWDFDWAWKNINDCDEFSRTDGSGWSYKIVDCPADVLSFGWFKRLLQDPKFANRVRCRWEDLRTSILKTEVIFNYIDSIELALAIPQQRHFAAFTVLGQNNGAPEVDAIPTTYHGEVVKLKNWISTRIQWLDANIMGSCELITEVTEFDKSQLEIYPNPGNGKFTISNSGMKIKYTLYNTQGLVVQAGELEAGDNQLELKSASGLYFLRTGNQILKVILH